MLNIIAAVDPSMLHKTETALGDSFRQAYEQVILLAPKVLVMLVVVVVGYIVARLVGKIFTTLSEKLGLQVAAERSGLAESMQHMGIKRSVPAIVGTIVFWLLMCVFITAAFNILELKELSAATGKLVNYIPNLLVATVVVVVGLLVASFLRGVVATSADRLGVSYAERLAAACYYALAILTFVMALKQLQLEFALLDQLIMIAFGGLALGFGLSFGLGGREVMGGILAGYYLRQRLQRRRPRAGGRPGRDGPRGRPGGHDSGDRRRRTGKSPHGAQHQDAQRGRAIRLL